MDQRIFGSNKLLDFLVVLEHGLLTINVHAVADGTFNVWYLVKPIINILYKRFPSFTTKDKHNSHGLLNSFKCFNLIIELEYFPIDQGIVMPEFMAAVIELSDVVADTYDGGLFDLFVDF